MLNSSQEYKEQLVNELIRLTSVASVPVISRIVTTPPTSGLTPDSYYIVPTGATGAWVGKTNQIAFPLIGLNGQPNGDWGFWLPFLGVKVSLTSGNDLFFDGTNWQTVINPSGSVLTTTLTGLSTATGGAITSSDNVLQGFGKLQKQLNDLDITGVTDGDKGDIAVSNSGTTWTINNQSVTYSKLQQTNSGNIVLGKPTNGSGTIAEIPIGIEANNLIRLDSTAKLPAVDGSQLTNLPVLSATQIRDSLATLTDSNRLDASAIKNLPTGGGGGSTEKSWPITIFALTANDPRLEGASFPKTLTLPPFPTGVTINKISGLINSLNSGSAVLSIQNGTINISGLDNLNCTTTVLADQLATANNILSAGGRLKISFSSITGLINISFRIDYTENP